MRISLIPSPTEATSPACPPASLWIRMMIEALPRASFKPDNHCRKAFVCSMTINL